MNIMEFEEIKNVFKKVLSVISKDKRLIKLEDINNDYRICVENLENLAINNLFEKYHNRFGVTKEEGFKLGAYLSKVDGNSLEKIYRAFDKEFRPHALEGETYLYITKVKSGKKQV